MFQRRQAQEGTGSRRQMKHLLLTTIAAVLVSCDWGPSTIHQAAYQGNNEAVKRYLEAGTDVSAKNKSGDRESTPLFESHHPLKFS